MRATKKGSRNSPVVIVGESLGPQKSRIPFDGGSGRLTAINCFDIAAEREAEFMAIWRRFFNVQRAQPGFLGNRMYRAADEATRFRFVNVVEWESADDYRNALASEKFEQTLADAGPAWDEFTRIYGRFELLRTRVT